MIEAVNSVLANASLLRGSVEQAGTAASFAANPDRVQLAAEAPVVPKPPYVSPYIALDLNYNKAILQIRDSETGDVVRQFPSEARLRTLSGGSDTDSGGETAGTQETGTGETAGIGFAAADVAQAQIASVALAHGAEAGVESLSAGVSVFA